MLQAMAPLARGPRRRRITGGIELAEAHGPSSQSLAASGGRYQGWRAFIASSAALAAEIQRGCVGGVA